MNRLQMSNRFDFDPEQPKATGGKPNGRRPAAPLGSHEGRLRLNRRVLVALSVLIGVVLVYCLHSYKLRETRRISRAELLRVLPAEKPGTADILAAFDRSTEDIFFAAAGPYFILTVAVVFLTGQLLGVKRRLDKTERLLHARRGPAFGMD